jgi:rRNA-processing protein EBP2
MGKKDPQNLRKKAAQAAQDSDSESDAELHAELQALAAIQAEREENENNSDEEGTLSKPTKRQRGIYNTEGLEQAVDGQTELDFLESYEICEFDMEPTDENDDLAREMAFYQHTLQAVELGRDRLKKLGVPIRRPDDYFAENMKSDAHMARVKDKLLLETKKMDAFEKRRQRETNRKYNKQLQDLRKKEKSSETKGEIKEFDKLRKGGATGQAMDEKVEALLQGRSGRGVGDRGRAEKGDKRLKADRKYGSGVKEKMRNKLNDKKSFNDMSSYNPRGGAQVRREKGAKGGKGGKGGPVKSSSNRPGKGRRDAKRGSK